MSIALKLMGICVVRIVTVVYMTIINYDVAIHSPPRRASRGGVLSAPLKSSLPPHLVTSLLEDHLARPDGRRECLWQSKVIA
jgi:hypothetical protein